MRAFFSRLGLTGLSIVVAALIFGALAGGIVVHRLTVTPEASTQQQGEQQGERSDTQSDTQKGQQTNNQQQGEHETGD